MNASYNVTESEQSIALLLCLYPCPNLILSWSLSQPSFIEIRSIFYHQNGRER